MRSEPARLVLATSFALVLVACGASAPSARPELSSRATRVAAASPAGTSVRRALVLSGGGPTGRAFEVGILKGLRLAGIDLTRADLIVGTSAGAVLGSQLRAGKSLDSMYDALLASPGARVAPSSAPRFDPGLFLKTLQMITLAAEVTPALRIEVGKRALAAAGVLSQDAQLRFIDADLGGLVHSWPLRPFKVAAGDLSDGTMRFFDSSQNVPIEQALAASTAMPARMAPITIDARRYMDGFVGGPCPTGCWPNLDGAIGYDTIVVVMVGNGPGVTQQIERLRAQGRHVVVIAPDAESAAARGQIAFDLTRVKPTAEAALRQAASVVAQVRSVWDEGVQQRP